MGYYVTMMDAYLSIPKAKEQAAYEALCNLNNRNDLKTGGRYPRPEPLPDGPNENVWFSWMDWNYPETCKNVTEILQQIGFDVMEQDDCIRIIGYDDKTGCEQMFLSALTPFFEEGYAEWRGEDGEEWRCSYRDGKAYVQSMIRSWGEEMELSPIHNVEVL